MADKPIGVDATGYEVLSKAVVELLNTYPGLTGRVVTFEQLDAKSGLAISASSGALVMSEVRDVVGGVYQTCQFPFFVVDRRASTTSAQKLKVQTFLDTLGKWLCKEPTEYEKPVYPELASGRTITRITRQNSYGVEPMANNIQDWLLPVTVEYTNEYEE